MSETKRQPWSASIAFLDPCDPEYAAAWGAFRENSDAFRGSSSVAACDHCGKEAQGCRRCALAAFLDEVEATTAQFYEGIRRLRELADEIEAILQKGDAS